MFKYIFIPRQTDTGAFFKMIFAEYDKNCFTYLK